MAGFVEGFGADDEDFRFLEEVSLHPGFNIREAFICLF